MKRTVWLIFPMLTILSCGIAALGQTPPAPDYSQAGSWAALPWVASAASDTPPGFTDQQATARADVFYIHPTTDFNPLVVNDTYNDPVSAAATAAAVENQASAFNGCCRIYAPLYRQASIGADITPGSAAAAIATFDLAYQDVKQAFLYYMANYNHGRPFIIAAHSQGSLHAERLIQELIVGTPLQNKLIAAYVVGSSDPPDPGDQNTFIGLPICNNAYQTGCAMNWDSYNQLGADISTSNGAAIWTNGSYTTASQPPLCVNPLTWQQNSSAGSDADIGSEPFTLVGPLPADNPQLTGAQCENGLLVIGPILAPGYTDASLTLLGNYHTFDYNLYYVNIRENAQLRTASYLNQHGWQP